MKTPRTVPRPTAKFTLLIERERQEMDLAQPEFGDSAESFANEHGDHGR